MTRLAQAVDILVWSDPALESCRFPRYTGPRCGTVGCGAALTVADDGFMTGCEHAGTSRNLTLAEQFTLRRAPTVETVVDPHPAPEVAMRDAEPGEIPGGTKQVLRKVVEPWRTRTTYSRGANLTAGKVVDSVVVRFAHPDGRRGWAGWVDGKFDVAFILVRGWVQPIGATALKAVLAQSESEPR